MKEFIKKIVFQYTNWGSPKYPYNIEPIQLATLINSIEQTKSLKGNIIEIGVARGMTTRFLAEHIQSTFEDFKPTIYAIDTFSGFLERDLNFEITNRNKTRKELVGFNYNNFKRWSKNFKKFPFVKPIKADCATLDYELFKPYSVVFLDVDLYLPTLNALPKLYESLETGGIIVLDDIRDSSSYDGAYHALLEFSKNNNISFKIIGNKCGVINKI